MARLFYGVLLGGLAASTVQGAYAHTLHAQAGHTPHCAAMSGGADMTDALNAQSLAHAQRPQPAPTVVPVVPVALPDGTIAKGTGVTAPELLDAPVYNPADRR